jgi:protein gp37
MQETELIPADRGEMNFSELLEREQRIERCQRNAYYEIGLELKAIRDRGGYKVQRDQPTAGRYSFTTFEEYCQDRWEMTPRRMNHLIESADAAYKMGRIIPILPSRESHVRELLKIENDEDRAKVWEKVTSNGNQITAKYINDQVTKYLAEQEKDWLTLEEWNDLEDDEKESALESDIERVFNYQADNDNIEWARWSWNPVTGCRHGCKYCYARDIAARFYPQGFKPSIFPSRLNAPKNTKQKQPKESWTDVDHMGHRNVFVCSMADLFGKWVPNAWIEAVLQQCWDNPQWNYLFLSKFPVKMADFEFPDNAWVGTSVDTQGAVSRAEKAFTKIKAKTTWLSCEPMLEHLQFGSLEMFDWVVIGGSSATIGHDGDDKIDKAPATPEFRPPFDWIVSLYDQARKANARVYFKTNLLGERVREYPS